MAPSNTTGKAFSIAKFKTAFSNSRAKQYMSDMEIEQVRRAIEDKDILLLGQLYEILLKEQSTDEQIVQDFVMTKNRILDDFMVQATSIEKKMVQVPHKQAEARAVAQEEQAAEDILKKL